jgi:hypothetical protein
VGIYLPRDARRVDGKSLHPLESAVAVVGLMTNDGKGKFSAQATANTNGVVTQEHFTGSNMVSSDGIIAAASTDTLLGI